MPSSYRFQEGYRGPGTPETDKDSELFPRCPFPLFAAAVAARFQLVSARFPQLVLTSLCKQPTCQQAPSKQTASMFHGCRSSVSRQISKRHASQPASKQRASNRVGTTFAACLLSAIGRQETYQQADWRASCFPRQPPPENWHEGC